MEFPVNTNSFKEFNPWNVLRTIPIKLLMARFSFKRLFCDVKEPGWIEVSWFLDRSSSKRLMCSWNVLALIVILLPDNYIAFDVKENLGSCVRLALMHMYASPWQLQPYGHCTTLHSDSSSRDPWQCTTPSQISVWWIHMEFCWHFSKPGHT